MNMSRTGVPTSDMCPPALISMALSAGELGRRHQRLRSQGCDRFTAPTKKRLKCGARAAMTTPSVANAHYEAEAELLPGWLAT